MPSVKQAKRLLRRQVSAALAAVPVHTIETESQLIVRNVLESAPFRASRNISIYLSTPSSEVQTDLLIRDSLARGKRVFVPFCPVHDKTVMRMLRLRDVEYFARLPLNRWGIREIEPSEAESCEDAEDDAEGGLDLIVVPGLAFDRRGQRLGHGRGYYDRYITATATYPSRFGKPPPRTLALALSAQILPPGELVPVEEWDRMPDLIATPEGFLQTQREPRVGY